MARMVVDYWPASIQRSRPQEWHRWVQLCAVLMVVLELPIKAAELQTGEPDPSMAARAAIEGGDFHHALELAQSNAAKTAGQHDAIISKVAQAQALAGDRSAALQAASLINDDRVLADTLSNIRSHKTAQGAAGGVQADFDPLIDLIKATVGPQTWTDTGGEASAAGFQGGVFVDPQGVLRQRLKENPLGRLTELRQVSASRDADANSGLRRYSALRKVSLTRLERQVQLLAAQGRRPSIDMQTLAGLQRIKYVLVYPEQGELVLAGPAGDWKFDAEGRLVGRDLNRPVLRLDDLVVVLRRIMSSPNATFGCSITPTQIALANVNAFLAESGQAPLKPRQLDQWLGQLREKLGRQEIEIDGIDPGNRAGRVIVEADYRMKLVGMGLEEGMLDVPSYLDMVQIPAGKAPPPVEVLRWWFTLKYDGVIASPARDAFELHGQGVQVLSENELLTAAGEQVHTGNSEPLNEQFAHNFTKHFEQMAVKYPIYAELQNLCDIALVGAILRSEQLPDKVHWHMLYFLDPKRYVVPQSAAPKTVETVMNYRVVNGENILVGVSGGVRIDPSKFVTPAAMKTDDYGLLKATHSVAMPKNDPSRERWWWD
jgi:Protein of unknown function (DUF1598)